MLKVTYCFVDGTKLTVPGAGPADDIDAVTNDVHNSLLADVVQIDDGKGNRWLAPRSSIVFTHVGPDRLGSGKVWG